MSANFEIVKTPLKFQTFKNVNLINPGRPISLMRAALWIQYQG